VMRKNNLTAKLAMGLYAMVLGTAEPSAKAASPRLPQDALPIPLVRQQSDHSCGPAVLVAVLRYFQVWDGPETNLHRLLGTSADQGTLPEAIAFGARRFGLQASVEQPMTLVQLQSAVRAGKPVILELQAWRDPKGRRESWLNNWDDGHYVVLTGMDHQYAYFMDPSTDNAYTYVPLQELLSRWHDVNPVRGPRSQHDYHLGIVISAPASIARHRGITRRSKIIDRLIKLD
ncbi:MAG TPA: C39 family peptidase, partial [Pseudomonadota bacterium]|nr:C39 family peptidase [Pseudomonadota bacterium]